MPYQQDDFRALETIYGVENETARIQDLGRVVTRQGRLLAFPNTLQHRVGPFHLADPTKPGHRKILALFLVDPHVSIISTANVPPQQKTWWTEQIEETGVLGRVPREIADHILDMADYPISLAEAKAQRLELMAERTNFVADYFDDLHKNVFSLCEH